MSAPDSASLPNAAAAPGRRAVLLAAGTIAAAALAVYANGWRIPLLFDDAGSITNNYSLRHLFRALRPLPGGLPVSGRPLVNFSFALNYALSGLEVWSYHLCNVAIHILAGLALFGIVRRTLAGWKGWQGFHFALAAALIWTLHPLQTEAVDYISQRAESLMGLFYLLTLYGFVRGAGPSFASSAAEVGADNKNGRRRWLGLSALACFLGMASKEVMVSAPAIVLLYDRTFVAGTFREAWRLRRKYYLALASSWAVLLWLVAGSGTRGGTAGFGAGLSSGQYALIQFQAIVRYLELSVWPHPLVFYYDRPAGSATVIGLDALVVLALLAGSLWLLFRPSPASRLGRGLGFAGVCFFAILAPSSSVVPVATETMAEHRMYLALAAVVVTGVAALRLLSGRIFPRAGALTWILPAWLAAVGLGWTTVRRNAVYRSDLALWMDTVAGQPGSSAARNNLANALLQGGDPAAAVAACRKALRLDPRNAKAHSNLANALMKMNRSGEAIGEYEEGVRLSPGDADIHNNLGIALARSGRLAEAVGHYETALRLRPDFAAVDNNLGNALVQLGRYPEAIADFERALALEPGYAGTRDNLGVALAAAGRWPEAIAADEAALQLQPDFPEAESHLGSALRAAGRKGEAAAHYERALQLRPGFAEARNNLGNLLLEDGKKNEAIVQYREALRLDPDNFEAHSNLGGILADQGQLEAAAEEFGAASRLRPDNAVIRNNLGCVLGELGRADDAAREFEAALRLDPRDAEARANLEQLRHPGRKGEGK